MIEHFVVYVILQHFFAMLKGARLSSPYSRDDRHGKLHLLIYIRLFLYISISIAGYPREESCDSLIPEITDQISRS